MPINGETNEGMTIQVPGTVTGQDAPQATPDGEKKFAGEFTSVEELEAKYAELKQQVETKPTEENPAPEGEQVNSFLDALGLDSKALSSEFEQTGALSDASYAALAAKGIDKATVDQYLKGAEATTAEAATLAGEVHGIVGGPEAYAEMMKWAATGLTKEQAEAFNRVIDGGDPYAVKLAVQDLTGKFREAVPQAPGSLVRGMTQPQARQGDAFRSPEEVVKAMSDPRYGSDRAYTRDVEAKIARSSVF